MIYWLTHSWFSLLHPAIASPALVITAVLCGGIVGTERERHEKPAGLRTLMLVCLGATVFTMVSFVFTSSTGDSGRVAAQIVTGVGFLGAGVILHSRGTVTGTTTAATIWMMASIGVVVGAGFAIPALALSVVVRFVLGTVSLYENRTIGEQQERFVELDFAPGAGITRVRLERILVDFRVAAVAAEWKSTDPETDSLILRLHLPRRALRELLDGLVSVPNVKAIREIPIGISASPPTPSVSPISTQP